jgi:phage shock protein A
MGIFDRFKRVVKSNINDIISKAENPEKVLNQLIIDMNSKLIESKKSVAQSIADEKKLEKQMNQHADQGKEWERKAMLAVKAGKDDLAKEALVRKQESENIAAQYKQQWEAQHEAVTKLKNDLRETQQKIEEAQRKKNILVARSKRANAQKKIQKAISGINQNSAFDAFDKMEEKIDRLEAENEAVKELEDLSKGSDIDKEFAELESSSSSADSMLEDLKKKMQLEDKTGQS